MQLTSMVAKVDITDLNLSNSSLDKMKGRRIQVTLNSARN